MTDVSVTLLPPCWCLSGGDQHGYIQSSINLDEILFWIKREWITAQILILTRLFRYRSSFISQLLDVIQWMVTILIFDGVTLQTSHYDINWWTCYWEIVWVQYWDLIWLRLVVFIYQSISDGKSWKLFSLLKNHQMWWCTIKFSTWNENVISVIYCDLQSCN